MITKIEHFTAAIQLITAVNFTFIFTHLPRYAFEQIWGYDIACREKFKEFRKKTLGAITIDINNMSSHIIDGVDTSVHREKLKRKLEGIGAIWDSCERKSVSAIKHLCGTKGFKCLFLFISVYCVFDLIAIPALKLWGNDFLTTLISLINVFAIFHTLKLTWVILRSKWKEKKDWECYNQTIWFLGFTFLGIIPVWFCVNFVSQISFLDTLNFNVVEGIKWIWEFNIWSCLILPFFPYMVSILYIFTIIGCINAMRWGCRKYILVRIFFLKRTKKRYDRAYATLTDVDWSD